MKKFIQQSEKFQGMLCFLTASAKLLKHPE